MRSPMLHDIPGLNAHLLEASSKDVLREGDLKGSKRARHTRAAAAFLTHPRQRKRGVAVTRRDRRGIRSKRRPEKYGKGGPGGLLARSRAFKLADKGPRESFDQRRDERDVSDVGREH